MSEQKLHWYTITFQTQLDGKGVCNITTYYGTNMKQLTLRNLRDATKKSGIIKDITKKTIVLNSMYLGYMTNKEFVGEK